MRRQVSTSMGWNIPLFVALVVVTLGVPWWNAERIDAYDAGVAAAHTPVPAQVVESTVHRRNDDRIVVAWRDSGNVERRLDVAVTDARRFPVGFEFDLWTVPGSDVVYATRPGVIAPTFYLWAGLGGVLLMSFLPIAYGVRFFRYWRARRAPPERVSMRLWRGHSTRPSPIGARIVWVRLTGADGDEWFQRVHWEPWLGELRKKSYEVSVQRVRGRGPALVTTPHGGRLWWAGRARAAPPSTFEVLTPGPPRPGGTRWSVVLVVSVISLVWIPVFGVLGAAIADLYTVGLIMFLGSSPLTSGRGGR